MDFISLLDSKIKGGFEGLNVGIYGGFPRFDNAVFNIQPGKMISIVGAPKSGKTDFYLYRYIFSPWISGERNVKWILYSLEVDPEQLAARLASKFIYNRFRKSISPSKLLQMGNLKMTADEFKMYETVKKEDLSELSKHLILISDKKDANPTGIYKYMMNYASNNGKFLTESYNTKDDFGNEITKNRRIGYVPNNPDEKVFIIIDTLGLMTRERNFSKKENMDKWLDDYGIELRNLCKYTIINCHHLNRGMGSVERKRYSKENIRPELEDIKDTSSIAESSDMVIGLFNPSSDTNLDTHFGYDLSKLNGNYRSIHVMASRYTDSFINIGCLFNFNSGQWIELPSAYAGDGKTPSKEILDFYKIYNSK